MPEVDRLAHMCAGFLRSLQDRVALQTQHVEGLHFQAASICPCTSESSRSLWLLCFDSLSFLAFLHLLGFCSRDPPRIPLKSTSPLSPLPGIIWLPQSPTPLTLVRTCWRSGQASICLEHAMRLPELACCPALSSQSLKFPAGTLSLYSVTP